MEVRKVTNMAVKGQQGFTLIEIMVAISILTIALLGLISVTVMVVKANSLSNAMTTATTLAGDKLEEVKNTSYNAIAGGTTIDYFNPDSSAGGAGAFYTRTLRVDTTNPEMKSIEVEVNWQWAGATRRVRLNTIMGR